MWKTIQTQKKVIHKLSTGLSTTFQQGYQQGYQHPRRDFFSCPEPLEDDPHATLSQSFGQPPGLHEAAESRVTVSAGASVEEHDVVRAVEHQVARLETRAVSGSRGQRLCEAGIFFVSVEFVHGAAKMFTVN